MSPLASLHLAPSWTMEKEVDASAAATLHAHEPISSEEADKAALLDSDSDCVVLMTQNPHE